MRVVYQKQAFATLCSGILAGAPSKSAPSGAATPISNRYACEHMLIIARLGSGFAVPVIRIKTPHGRFGATQRARMPPQEAKTVHTVVQTKTIECVDNICNDTGLIGILRFPLRLLWQRKTFF